MYNVRDEKMINKVKERRFLKMLLKRSKESKNKPYILIPFDELE